MTVTRRALDEARPARPPRVALGRPSGPGWQLRRLAQWPLWRAAESLHRARPWWRRSRPVGTLLLIGLRSRLRHENLFDADALPTGPGPVPTAPDWDPRFLVQRAPDGSWNDLDRPTAGMAGMRFGRNVPLRESSDQGLCDPAPARVADRLLVRPEGAFAPFPEGNSLLAAWIQFMVRDWFNHGRPVPPCHPCGPLGRGPGQDRRAALERMPDDPTAWPGHPVTHRNLLTHWWDGSQIYPAEPHLRRAVRRDDHGRPLPDGRLREDLYELLPEPSHPERPPAAAPGFWVGLALMMGLFAREHNAICAELRRAHPGMASDDVFETARLVNTALMAKIHTLDWTAAALAHPTTVRGTKIEWWGLLGKACFDRFGRGRRLELLNGIPGSKTRPFGVPFSLTEEFSAVYRMHAMLPDALVLKQVDHRDGASEPLDALLGRRGMALLRSGRHRPADLLYSFGTGPAGVVELHNVPRLLQRPAFEVDLADVDVLRCREAGVPRYNRFRELLHLGPVRRMEDVCSRPGWCDEIRDVYGDDPSRVDLLVGLFAEDRPPGFAFSDSAFRVFLLMAARRLLSDRFLTASYTADVYTPEGVAWVEATTFKDVLCRHHPELGRAMRGVDNAFHPWAHVRGC